MTDREKAKDFLKSYERSIKDVNSLALQIEALKAAQTGGAIKYSDMPKAHNIRDLSDYAARLDELERQLGIKQREAFQNCRKVMDAINSLPDPDERCVLTLRYVNLMNWKEIEYHLHLSEKTIHRKHGRGIDSLFSLKFRAKL